MTATNPYTKQREGRAGPSWSHGGSLIASVLLMAALFLTHGLQLMAAIPDAQRAEVLRALDLLTAALHAQS